MSEKLDHSGERNAEAIDVGAESQRNLDRLRDAAEKAENAGHEVAEIQQQTAEHAVSGKEFTVGEQDSSPTHHQQLGEYKQLKADAYAQTLGRVQKRLSKPERTFSKVMHQPIVDTVSAAMSNTVARPSGILGAGIAASVGGLIVIYMAKKYGFEYNHTTFFVLLAIGCGAGLFAELLFRVLKKIKR
jgi:hypothetical protein